MRKIGEMQFLGRWYVIQKFSTASSCWTYDFIRNKTDGSLKIVQSRDHVILDTVGLDNNYRYTGSLDVPDSNRPGFMRVRFPMSKNILYRKIANCKETVKISFNCKAWPAKLITWPSLRITTTMALFTVVKVFFLATVVQLLFSRVAQPWTRCTSIRYTRTQDHVISFSLHLSGSI